MAANLSGTLNVFRALVQPRLIVPHLSVKTIRAVDWRALKHVGYVGAVFDKDNCLTKPYDDKLVPELKEAWEECKQVFGRDNVLIVSNSAGTKSDAGLIQAESVSYHLGVPVLAHRTKKPGCLTPIIAYFSERHPPPPSSSSTTPHPYAPTSPTRLSALFAQRPAIPTPKIIVVGDRLFTDVLMANRLGSPVLAIWTTGLWVKESMFLRWLEGLFLGGVRRYRAYRRRKAGQVEVVVDENAELAKAFLTHPHTHHRRHGVGEVAVHQVPRAWYVHYPLVLLGSSWRGVRWVVGRLTEGKAVKEARRAEKAEVDRILRGDPDHLERVGAWRKVLQWIRARSAEGEAVKGDSNVEVPLEPRPVSSLDGPVAATPRQ